MRSAADHDDQGSVCPRRDYPRFGPGENSYRTGYEPCEKGKSLIGPIGALRTSLSLQKASYVLGSNTRVCLLQSPVLRTVRLARVTEPRDNPIFGAPPLLMRAKNC